MRMVRSLCLGAALGALLSTASFAQTYGPKSGGGCKAGVACAASTLSVSSSVIVGTGSVGTNLQGNNVHMTISGGSIAAAGIGNDGVGGPIVELPSIGKLGWASTTDVTANTSDTLISRAAPATVQLGGSNAASPVAQTLQAQGSRGGTDTNVSGANLTIGSGDGTGSGTGSTLTFQTPHATTTGTTQQTMTSQLVLGDNTVAVPTIAADTAHTDATICEDTTSHVLYSGSGTIGICLGTSSERYKHGLKPLDVGLPQIMALRPVRGFYNADHGDPTKVYYWVTAEDANKSLPALVGLDTKGRPNSMDLVGLIPVLVRAMQDQQREIEALKAQLHHTRH